MGRRVATPPLDIHTSNIYWTFSVCLVSHDKPMGDSEAVWPWQTPSASWTLYTIKTKITTNPTEYLPEGRGWKMGVGVEGRNGRMAPGTRRFFTVLRRGWFGLTWNLFVQQHFLSFYTVPGIVGSWGHRWLDSYPFHSNGQGRCWAWFSNSEEHKIIWDTLELRRSSYDSKLRSQNKIIHSATLKNTLHAKLVILWVKSDIQ